MMVCFIFSGLLEGLEYQFRVLAENAAGISKPSDASKSVEVISAVGAPFGLEVTDVSRNSISLKWKKPLADGGSRIAYYFIDRRHVPDGRWLKCNFTNVTECNFEVAGLTPNESYEFRVSARNAVGTVGVFSDVFGPIACKPKYHPPTIDLDSKFMSDVVHIRAGDNLRLEVLIGGKPRPSALWFKGETELVDTDHVTIVDAASLTTLVVKEVTRNDSARYTLLLRNECGEKKASINLKVLDTPGKPKGPLTFSRVTAEKCNLAWERPEEDGGAEITHYVVDKRETSRVSWVPLPQTITNTTCTAPNLIPNNEYVFRVAGVNKYGRGPFLESNPIVAKNQFVVPTAPGQPEVVATTKDSVTITWTRPSSDGGSNITNFVIEKRDKQSQRWLRCNKGQEVTDLRFRVVGLKEKNVIEFRVAAENGAGQGPYSSSSRYVCVQDPLFPPSHPNHFRVTDITKNSLSFAWGPPLFDGGSPVKGYIIEASEKVPGEDATWRKMHKSNHIVTTEFTANGLTEGHLYAFRIYAVNDQGVSEEASSLADDVLVKDVIEEPEIDMDDMQRRTVSVHAGKPLSLDVTVRGRPAPSVTWSKTPHGEDLKAKSHIDSNVGSSRLQIDKTDRYDAGKFTVVAENVAGRKEVSINVRVYDTPDKPGPIALREVTRDSVTLAWDAPEIDGGSAIRSYVVQKREASRRTWNTVLARCPKMSCKIDSLVEGVSYFFRVLAENEFGAGEGRETETAIKMSEQPSPPLSIEVIDVTAKSVLLGWQRPELDGGSRIDNYIVEIMEKGTAKWVKAGATKDLHFQVKGLKEGLDYYFRVSARNESGLGEPGELLSSVTVKEHLLAPFIDMSNLPEKTLIVKAGDPIALSIPISGRPAPSVVWTKHDKEIIEDLHRTTLTSTESQASLEIRESTADDRGDYKLLLSNTSGACSQSIHVVILDKPSPPQGPLEVSDVSADTVVLTWKAPLYDGGAAISNYVVEKRESQRPNWVTVSDTVTRTTAKVPRLNEDTEYVFRVMAQNRFGTGKAIQSECVVVRSQFGLPGAPGTPQISSVTKDSMTVLWMEPVNDGGAEITGYIVERKEPKASRWIRATRSPVSQTRFVSTGLIEGVEYIHRVIAINAKGEGKPSKATASATCQEPVAPPSAPKNPVVVDITKNTLSVAWDKPDFEGGSKLLGYYLEMRDESTWWKRCNATPIRITEYTIKGLPEGGQYHLRVLALNAGGVGQPAEIKDPVIIKDMSGPPEVLDEFENTVIARRGGIIRLRIPFKCRPSPQVQWKKVTGHKVDLNVRSMMALHENIAELVIKDVDRRDAGEYQALLINKMGEKEVKIHVKVIGRPDAPEGPMQFGDIAATSLKVLWKPVLNDGGSQVTNYVLERREVGKTAWLTVDSKIRSNHFVVKGLTEGVEYYFKVYAENAFGYGDALTCTKAVVPRNPLFPPQPPQVVEINEIFRDRVSVSWNRTRDDGGSPVTGYFVERREATSDRWVRVNKVLTKSLSFVAQGLVEDAEYQFRVIAVSDVGEGEPSVATELVVCKDPFDKPSPPEDIEVHHVARDSVTLAWNKPVFDGGKGIQGYIVEHRELGMSVWKQSSSDVVRDRIYQVGGLDPGADYEFRISAVNELGRSRPRMMETSVMTRKVSGERPEIVKPIATVTAIRGSNATLSCAVTARPLPDVTWIRHGKEIKSGRKHKMLSEGQTNSLCIDNVSDEDDGTYHMFAKNDVGTLDLEGSLVVEGSPILDERSSRFKGQVTTRSQQTLRIHVPYIGKPQADATWFKEGKRIEKSEFHEMETTDSYVHLVVKNPIRQKDSGKYTVKLSNVHGSNSYAIDANVQDVPSKPHDIQVSEVTYSSMVLSWKVPHDDGGASVSNYIIEKRDIDGEEDTWTLVTSNTTQCHFRVSKLMEKHAYYFRVFAENCFGVSLPQETDAPIAAKPPHDVPQQPSQPGVSGVSKEGCTLAWKQPKHDGGSRITNYIVERRDNRRVRWMRVNDETLTQSVCNVTGLVEGFVYEFRVIAENSAGQSEPSEISEKVVPKDDIRIVGPKLVESLRDLVVKPNQNATFSCKISGHPKPVVKWYRGGKELSGSSKHQMHEGKGNHYSLVISEVTAADEMPYTVRAINQGGSVSVTARLDVQLPAQVNIPKHMMTEATTCKVHEVVSLKVPIQGKPTPDVTWTKAGKLVNPDSHRHFVTTPSFTSMTITNAERSDSGFYNITVKNRFGTQQGTVELQVGDVPSRPDGVEVSEVTRDSLKLSWKEPSDNGGKLVLKYVVEKSTAYSDRWMKVSSTGTTHYTVTGLSGKTSYQFRVKAENEYGQSKPSPASISVTTKEDKMMGANYDDMVDATEKFVAGETQIHQASVLDKYQIMEELGRGAFGVVHRAREISTGKNWAIKICRFADEADKVPVHREVEIMRKLQHPRVLQLHEVFDVKGEMSLIIQFVSGGNLLERVTSLGFNLTENTCAYLMRQICEALAYIHSQRVAHLDLKPDNILFVTRTSKKIKLIDFGVSRQLKPGEGKCFLYFLIDICINLECFKPHWHVQG